MDFERSHLSSPKGTSRTIQVPFCEEKVFNLSELHFSKVTSYKIYTLVKLPKSVCLRSGSKSFFLNVILFRREYDLSLSCSCFLKNLNFEIPFVVDTIDLIDVRNKGCAENA